MLRKILLMLAAAMQMALIFSLSEPAWGDEKRVALLIGNSAYRDSPLANPVNDATDMAEMLQRFGFKVILRLNVDTREMRQAIREFGSELRHSQVGVFYFAGHGVQARGINYLVPVGTDIQTEPELEDLAIDANLVLRTMEDARANVSITILDACRNNPFSRNSRSAARGLGQMNAAAGSVIAFSTAPGSTAADGRGRNSVYTRNLLASLKQLDTDILKVFQRTRAAVVKETGGRQTPWESTSLLADFYFRPPSVDEALTLTMQRLSANAAPSLRAGPARASGVQAIRVEGLPIVPGDTVAQVQAAYQTQIAPVPPADARSTYASSLKLASSGVWVFFDDQGDSKTIRLFAPFSGSISSVRIGDSLTEVKTRLGEPTNSFNFGEFNAHFFQGEGRMSARYDTNKAGRVEVMYLLRNLQ